LNKSHSPIFMKHFIVLSFLISLNCCAQPAQNEDSTGLGEDSVAILKIQKFYETHKGNEKSSVSQGTVSDGALLHGKLMPYFGKNYRYFDTLSYFKERGYVNDRVKSAIISTYKTLEQIAPGRMFCVMECSNKNGGKIPPHRTHQNGLSVDFMVPLMKNKLPYYGLDSLGKEHYWLDFDSAGRYSADTSIKVDFDMVALHLLLLEKSARKNGLRISKVIIKTEFLDELYASSNGRLLKKSGIYTTKALSPLINSLHDDHYHVDFEVLAP
jgi:penicillin-insensitive murein endopeptidase